MKKKTLGEIVHETLENNTLEDDVREYGKVMGRDILKDIWRVVYESQSHDLYKNRDFYIVATFLSERMANNMPKPVIWARRSAPTPVYKQNVWKYHHLSGSLELLWSIPDKLTYYYLIRNYDKLPEDHKQRAQFCILMENGQMLEWVKKENGEKIDGVIKINQEPVCLTN